MTPPHPSAVFNLATLGKNAAFPEGVTLPKNTAASFVLPGHNMARQTRWFQTKKFWALVLTPLVLFLLVFYGLDPLVEWRTREALKLFQPQYLVTFEDASLQPTKLNYALTHLKIMKESAGGNAEPYIYIDRLEMGVYGKELLHLHLVATMELEKVRLNLIAAKSKENEQLDTGIPDFSDKLAAALPLTVDRVQVKDAEVMFIDKTNPDFPKVWLHAIDGTLENLATRAALARGEPTSIAISGKIQKTGEISAFITADPLSKGLFFAGRAMLTHFEMNELGKVMASKSGLTVQKGTLDLFAEFDCRAGKLSGGIKPVLKNVEVAQGKPGLSNAINAVLADAAVKIFSDRVGDRAAVATVIPIRGDIDQPQVQLWPAVVGVIRNAFVIGVSESFQRLPLPKSDKPQGPIDQALDALDKKEGPKAQPPSPPKS